MSRNEEIRRILESREIAQKQNWIQRAKQNNRNARRSGQQPALEYLYCRDSRFPWK